LCLSVLVADLLVLLKAIYGTIKTFKRAGTYRANYKFSHPFFILRAFAWKKFLNILDQRKERIAAEFNKIESAKAQLEKLKQEYEGKLARIEEEARQKIQEAETRADQLSREIKDEARNQAKALLERNKEDIQIELSQARQQLKTISSTSL